MARITGISYSPTAELGITKEDLSLCHIAGSKGKREDEPSSDRGQKRYL
jgi:hypothetical protein